MSDRGPLDYDEADALRQALLKRDNIIYVRERGTDFPSKMLAWVGGIGATIVTAAILFAASALWTLNDRLARIETQVQAIDKQLNPPSRYRGEQPE